MHQELVNHMKILVYLQAEKEQSKMMDSTSELNQILRDEATFIANISQYYNQEALSDVMLKIGDTRYFGHKFVLAKSSDVFKTMLYEKHWSRDTKDEVELDETVECQAVFDTFLRYLYTAEVSISTSSAVGILCLADKYNVTSLKNLCSSYMVENSRSPKTGKRPELVLLGQGFTSNRPHRAVHEDHRLELPGDHSVSRLVQHGYRLFDRLVG